MSECSSDYDDDTRETMLIIASTFYCMSAQQGYDVAKEALSRIIHVEYSRLLQTKLDRVIDSEEAFLLQPVVQTALVAS